MAATGQWWKIVSNLDSVTIYSCVSQKIQASSLYLVMPLNYNLDRDLRDARPQGMQAVASKALL